jgi:hypothetical protein
VEFINRFIVLVTLIAHPLVLYAQSSDAAITGLVDDPAKASISGAKITVINTDTGVRTSVTTNGQGGYAIPGLNPGPYRVEVEKLGFKTIIDAGLVLHVQDNVQLNFHMAVGSTSESISVQADTVNVPSTDASVSSAVPRTYIENLPSIRRNYTDFVLLTPNVTADGEYGDLSFAGTVGGPYSTYGISNASNTFLIDGANDTSLYWGSARGLTRIPYLFGAEAVQEFQVSVNPYSPEYGGAASGFVNTITKSGTNSFHGQAYYYNQNSGTGASDTVSKANGYPKALDVRQQFGAGIGGPIIKNKLFFLFDYEQQRRKNPISVINSTLAAVDATSFGVPAGTVLPTATGIPAPNSNSTPAPSNPAYLQQVANALSVLHDNLGVAHRRQDDLAFFQKVDWQPGDQDRLSFEYNYNTFNSPGGTITTTPVFSQSIQALPNDAVRDHEAIVHWVHILVPTVVNDAHLSYGRDEQLDVASGLLPSSFPSYTLLAPTSFLLGNSETVHDLREYAWSGSDQLSYQRGRQLVNMGVELTHESIVNYFPGNYNGAYVFTSLSDFALGKWNVYQQSGGNPLMRVGYPVVGFYVGDKIQVNNRLSLTLGIREDFEVFPQPVSNPAIPLTGRFDNDYNRWAPRFGFVYQALPGTVIRGGGGLFRVLLTGENYIKTTTPNGLPSYSESLTLSYNSAESPTNQAVVFPNNLPSNSSLFAASPDVSVFAPGFKDPSTIQSSLQIEQAIGKVTSITVGTLWVHGFHLISSGTYDLNLTPPVGTTEYVICPAGTISFPCSGPTYSLPNLDSGLLRDGRVTPNAGQINALISPGNNQYISGFFEFRRRVEKGFSAIGSYTLSKNTTSNGVDFNNQFDFSNTRGLSTLDQRHHVAVGAVWEPRPGFNSAFNRTALSNWTLSTSIRYGSGHPYPGTLAPACVGSSLSSCIGGDSLNNTAANRGAAAGIAGAGPSPNIGLNAFEGPWSGSVDVALQRAIYLKENGRLIFRAEGFNILNNPNYYVQSGSGVNTTEYRPGGPTCGDGKSVNQTCYLVPNNSVGGFGTLNAVTQNLGPRIFQFSVIYRF